MQRILDPAQIEAFADRSVPRIRLPDPASLFARRGQRLRALAEGHGSRGSGDVPSGDRAVSDRAASDRAASEGTPSGGEGTPSGGEGTPSGGDSLGDYLRLMSTLADRQQVAADTLRAALAAEQFAQQLGRQIELAHEHRMPLLQAAGWPRQERWRTILNELCSSLASASGFPAGVRSVCERIVASTPAEIETQADMLLTARTRGVEVPMAPFVMAALQVYWAAMASSLRTSDVTPIDVPGVCPMCGTLPVASVVRSDKGAQGYRYLHCALCATEWHMVRITCSQCLANEGIVYHSIEGGSGAVRAEACGQCHTYRKILYQEKDMGVEPVADDLASLALDLLMTEEGFHRGSGSPLLWQNTET
ncbi:MAG: formate dehydrogenase accessory protein FdhE [Steroidobacteraceae bacterium]